MRSLLSLSSSWLLVLGLACGPNSNGQGDEGLGPIESLDTSEAGITAFVREGRYRDWVAEPKVHATRAPHQARVRVFFNDTAVTSLRAGNAVHPVGTILVKELFAEDGVTKKGHAVEVKVAEGPGKDTWLFYEGFTPDYTRNYYGRGHDTCHGCHAAGTDYVTTPLP
ncbi:cytochrome P460 family protein [Archangium primigenium]|uniref:cytochrome P460 family protein n=1 Tax=[Archangium] primigenium TaxID=2792470 RepID=UPI001957CB43|nr:cytochrome P460 family protein [Archangium primigenium]MBM7116099.1 cytochrome P460 family protein [Archangium primigenium]